MEKLRYYEDGWSFNKQASVQTRRLFACRLGTLRAREALIIIDRRAPTWSERSRFLGTPEAEVM
jgi:hypothetical protein